MYHAARMRLNQRSGFIDHDRHSELQVEFTCLHQIAEGSPLGKFHYEEWPAFFRFSVVKQRRDAGVVQLRHGASLSQKARAIIVEVRTERGKLNGHPPAEVSIFGEINGTHATFTKWLENSVM